MTTLLELEPQRRDAILNAALKEFALQGYDNASTNVIAKEAGISKALMFHYVSSKQELFLVVYDYFFDLIQNEYFALMDYEEQDIFNRLRQSYLLQIRLSERYPFIFEFRKLSRATNSAAVNAELERRRDGEQAACFPKLFDQIDETKFREGLQIELCKQFIFWANVGFTNQMLEKLRNQEKAYLDDKAMLSELDGYFDELRKIFYGQ